MKTFLSLLSCLVACLDNSAAGAGIRDKDSSQAAVRELTARALEGDGEAALRLSGFSHLNDEERAYWVTISAENGFPPGMYVLGMSLNADSGDPRNRIRARYWLQAALKRGEPFAAFGLCVTERKEHPNAPPCELPAATPEEDSFHRAMRYLK